MTALRKMISQGRWSRIMRVKSARWAMVMRFVSGRVRDEGLPQVAGSLTFTTVLALVPILTIALAIFTAFPLFGQFRGSLESYFVDNLMPVGVARTVLDNLNAFASKSARLSAVGGVALLVTSGLTMATIDRVFNRIWGVTSQRAILQRLLVYWSIISIGPFLVGVSVTATSWIVRETGSLLSMGGSWVYSVLSVVLTSIVFTALYVVVPNTTVRWRDALWGGLLAGICTEVMKHVFAVYIIRFPTYTIVYGALAALPIFLIWIYVMWLITLIGAAVAASIPLIRYERWWHTPAAGSHFIDAVAMLTVLRREHHHGPSSAVSLDRLRRQARLGAAEAEALLSVMQAVGWVGQIERPARPAGWRFRRADLVESWTLLVNPAQIMLSDVYRCFAFDTGAAMRMAPALTSLVSDAIHGPLSISLESWLGGQEHGLRNDGAAVAVWRRSGMRVAVHAGSPAPFSANPVTTALDSAEGAGQL